MCSYCCVGVLVGGVNLVDSLVWVVLWWIMLLLVCSLDRKFSVFIISDLFVLVLLLIMVMFGLNLSLVVWMIVKFLIDRCLSMV